MNLSLARRRAARRSGADAEAVLWEHLRGKRLGGFEFRRQQTCGPYLLGLYCPARRLVVELALGEPFDTLAEPDDARRTRYLGRRGIRLLRVPAHLVFDALPALLEAIVLTLGAGRPPEGGGEVGGEVGGERGGERGGGGGQAALNPPGSGGGAGNPRRTRRSSGGRTSE